MIQPKAWSKTATWVPAVVLVVSLTAGALVFIDHSQEEARLAEQIEEENQLRTQSTLEHVEEYFDAVYSTLLFVSLDDDVRAGRKDSQSFIQRLYDHEWERHRLAELYVVERAFTGKQKPYQTFERGVSERSLDELHSLARERDEYQTQQEQIRQFLANTNLPALISPEIQLCVNDPDGKRALGFVYSVPIHSPAGLAGIVAGMIPSRILEGILERDQYGQVALLINDRSEIYGGRELPKAVMAGIRTKLKAEGVRQFFSSTQDSYTAHGWTARHVPAKIVSAEKWHLLYLYPKGAHLKGTLFPGVSGRIYLAFIVTLAGMALALLAHATAKRLEEKVRHLDERDQLQRQLQEVSEREQRRIGENLHEDLCQRLAGLEAASRALQKQLAPKRMVESDLVVEMGSEIREILDSAQQLADELQPVSLLDKGFLAAIEHLAVQTQQRSGLPCQVESDGFPHLDDAGLATHLYRITQEALANAVQHAQATNIRIRLSAANHEGTLAVTDDGKGMLANRENGPGLGLRIMRCRADLIHGRLQVQSAHGGGTSVVCVFELPPLRSDTLAGAG